MERYGGITTVTFGQTSLGLPVSARLFRRAAASPAGGDDEAFVTSVQLDPPVTGIEVRVRDIAAAEGLSLGQADILVVQLAPTRSGQPGRTITIDSAVLTGVELQYDQAAPASAQLSFAAEATDGDTDPFAAEESQE